MIDVVERSTALMRRLETEHTSVAREDTWIAELDCRRREIAIAHERILQRAKIAAGM